MTVYLDELVLETKQSKMLSSSLMLPSGTWMWPQVNIASMAQEGYAQNPDVYSCIVLKEKAVSGIPLKVMQYASDGTTKQVIDANKNPLLKLLDRPNPYESWPKFSEHLVGDLEHAGNAYIERVGPDKYQNTRPRELNLLPPKDMIIQRGDARQPVESYQWGGDVTFKPWQILHLKKYNPTDSFYGLSPLSAAAHAIDQNNAAANWNYSLFKNAGRPSGILTLTEEVIDEAAYDDIVTKLRNQNIGESNAGQVMVLTGDMKWTPTSFSPLDMDFRNMCVANTRHIASVFGVPPQLIGEESSKTYSNYSEARQAFYKETILPDMDWILAELTAWLAPLYGDNYKIIYDKGAIEALSEDIHARYDRILRGVAGGVLTINEGRKVLSYPPIKGGDIRLIPLNLAPEDLWAEMAKARAGVQNPPDAPGTTPQDNTSVNPQDNKSSVVKKLAPPPQTTGRPTNAQVPQKEGLPQRRGGRVVKGAG